MKPSANRGCFRMNARQNTIGNELELIEFYIDEELEDGSRYRSHFAMNVVKALEIIRKPQVTQMPGSHHPAALGTFNLRGNILPLVDLGIWLGKKTVDESTHKVVVSEFSGTITAFEVSGVVRIHRMTWTQVEPPGKHLQTFCHNCVTGIVRIEERILFLLDTEQILASMDPSARLDNRIDPDVIADGNGYSVLVAEDSPSTRNVIVSCLEQAKFKVTKSGSGNEAWDMLKTWERQAKKDNRHINDYVNLIISDIEMPEMDGLSLTRMIKSDPAFKNIPVILFSSLISPVVHTQGANAGADGQISKPDIPLLSHKACELIARFQGQGQGLCP